MVAYNVKELISILIRKGLLFYNTQIPVFSSKISYIFLPPTFFLSCFILIFQLIENQTFQEMKHWHSMFHFWFQCFSGVSPIGFWILSHWGFKSLPLGFDFSPSVFFGKGRGKWKMKLWNQKWNIETLSFISWNVWFPRSWNIKMKHERKNVGGKNM